MLSSPPPCSEIHASSLFCHGFTITSSHCFPNHLSLPGLGSHHASPPHCLSPTLRPPHPRATSRTWVPPPHPIASPLPPPCHFQGFSLKDFHFQFFHQLHQSLTGLSFPTQEEKESPFAGLALSVLLIILLTQHTKFLGSRTPTAPPHSSSDPLLGSGFGSPLEVNTILSKVTGALATVSKSHLIPACTCRICHSWWWPSRRQLPRPSLPFLFFS